MSSIEINKIAASVLLALIVAWVSGLLASKLIEPKLPQHAAVEVANAPAAAAPAASQAAAAAPSPWVRCWPPPASTPASRPRSHARPATPSTRAAPNRVGPNLYGVVGDEIAHDRGGYAFSDALKKKGGNWTVDSLNEWLFKPQGFVKGTKMTFVGLPKAKDRADVIAYLNSLSDSPKPLTAGK